MPYLDRLLTVERSRRWAAVGSEIYQAVEHDPDFRQLGSAMGWAYADLLGQPFDVGHYYLYVPKDRPAGPLPAVIFLHGSAGNFKAYTWLWSKLAEKQKFVVIAPSFGFGNWRRPGGLEAILAALDDAAAKVELDANEIYLAGLSNGGLGVSQAAGAAAERFHGLILISPVMANEIVDRPDFQARWRDRPMLFITGQLDERVSVGYVEGRVATLKAGGVRVTSRIYPDEDHFLIFSQAEAVFEVIAAWLAEESDRM
jgi:pimeloyl-ACP methyl ester carboxylesterase